MRVGSCCNYLKFVIDGQANVQLYHAKNSFDVQNFPFVHTFYLLYCEGYRMITRNPLNELLWVDVENPSIDEIRELMDEFDLTPLLADQLLSPSVRPKQEDFGNYLFLVLQFPALKHTNSHSTDQEIDFIIAEKFIITVRYDTIDAMHRFSKIFEVQSILGRETGAPTIGDMFSAMLIKLYRSIIHELEYIHDELEEAESEIFDGNEKEMVVVLSNLSRDLLNIKQALTPHRDLLDAVRPKLIELFGDTFKQHHNSIVSEYYRVSALRSVNSDSLKELRETNNSLLTTKQNEIMKILTIIAFVTFPLSLIAAVFGMNTQFMPVVGQPGDFWILTGSMGFATLMMLIYFKFKKWL